MDVVNLHEVTESAEPQGRICVVTDEIVKAIRDDSHRNFSMYVVFRREMDMAHPFMLLYLNKDIDVTRLDANFVRKNAHPMWTDRDGNEAPLTNRLQNEMIKVDFYESKSGIVYTWTDIYENETGQRPPPMRIRCLQKIQNDAQMNLHIFLPVCASTVLVLSERAYGSFMSLNMLDTPVALTCSADFMTGSESWTMYDCGHSICQKCYKNIQKKVPPQCIFHCALKTDKMVRLKLRHGPCPIDCCKKTTDKGGVALIPCGCFIQCEKLLKAYKHNEPNLEPLIQNIQICPYDMCGKKISGFKYARD